MKNKHVQFSKKIVVAVCIAVTVISCMCIILDFIKNDVEQVTEIAKVYIQYAMVVFAAYSGNSAVEKWILNKGKVLVSEQADEEGSH